MKEITKFHLKNAFGGESMANIRYKIYSEQAEAENYSNISLLFESIAFAEYVHARNHLTNLPNDVDTSMGHAPFGIGNTAENLEKGIKGEEFEINEMYPTYKEVAEFQNENDAKISFKWALEAEKTHERFFKEAKEKVEDEEIYELREINVCSICGFTTEGEAPDQCPICGADRKKFREFR